MRNKSFSRRWFIGPALLVAFCSGGDSPTAPSKQPLSVAKLDADSGAVGASSVTASAVGDMKIGVGPLEIERLRMDRQTSTGASIVRQYANPGMTYAMNAGETIELWAEYPAVVPNPRFKVSWGDESEPDITGCGSCLPEAPIYQTRPLYRDGQPG